MSVISFDDWKKKKDQASAFNARGDLREEITLKEEYGYDLCVLISEECSSSDSDSAHLNSLWQDLRALMNTLPREHAYHYFKAFEAFFARDEETFFSCIDRFFESEKRLYGEIADCDWWIDCFIWVFMPPFPGMYGRCAELFFKHWPLCAMGWVCEAIEQGEAEEESVETQLDLLMLAIQADKKCFIAYYHVAMIYYDQRQWRSSLPYFEKAASSSMYSGDPAFYFDYAWAAEKAGKPDLALKLYTSCLALDERYPCAVNNMGCIYMRQAKYDEALREFNKAVNLSLDGALPYRNIVAVLECQKKYDECVKFIGTHSDRLGMRYLTELSRLKALKEEAKEEENIPSINAAESDGKGAQADRDELLFGKRMLEDEIEDDIDCGRLVFGRKLAMYEDENGYGRQYYIPGAGRIDLLCVDKNSGELCVIAVYNGAADESALPSIWQQIAAVRKHISKGWQGVAGFIICAKASEALIRYNKRLNINNVSVYEYSFYLRQV